MGAIAICVFESWVLYKTRIQKLTRVHLQSKCKTLNVLNGHVPQATLNRADVGPIKRRPVCQFLLREALGRAH